MGDKLLTLFVCLVCVNHDNTLFGPGQAAGAELELTDEQAAPLLAAGAIKLKSEVDAEPAAADVPVDDAALATASQAHADAVEATEAAKTELAEVLTAKEAAQAELDAVLEKVAAAKADAAKATATQAATPAKKK